VGARVTLEELEAEHIRRILAASRNLDEAARTLGIDPATLYRKRVQAGPPLTGATGHAPHPPLLRAAAAAPGDRRRRAPTRSGSAASWRARSAGPRRRLPAALGLPGHAHVGDAHVECARVRRGRTRSGPGAARRPREAFTRELMAQSAQLRGHAQGALVDELDAPSRISRRAATGCSRRAAAPRSTMIPGERGRPLPRLNALDRLTASDYAASRETEAPGRAARRTAVGSSRSSIAAGGSPLGRCCLAGGGLAPEGRSRR
jgi:hypothetical protein